ncbi:hypothetical protein QFZ62_000702 [Clavibacter sp. B3I6]|uniref:DUF7169 domain-containing protein n=1 Tax=Clavibacter sp. B3I6 TaxID=3042268 RepID=UPI002780E202|nr:hypothetical protein [Clavibacter sp. B3I6]MDQ0743394.1 hypothetical protein [Clavibacter sp. B3I6]
MSGPLAGTPVLERFVTAALSLAAVREGASVIQWQASPRVQSVNLGVQVSGIPDPVFATVADERRLALREQMVESDRLLEQAVDLLVASRLVLRDAMGHEYEGE